MYRNIYYIYIYLYLYLPIYIYKIYIHLYIKIYDIYIIYIYESQISSRRVSSVFISATESRFVHFGCIWNLTTRHLSYRCFVVKLYFLTFEDKKAY